MGFSSYEKHNLPSYLESKEDKKSSKVLTLILIGVCIPIYFINFISSYLLWQSIILVIFAVYLFTTKKNTVKNNTEFLLPLYVFCIYLFINMVIGGSVNFIVAFLLNVIMLLFFLNTSNANIGLSKVMMALSSIHLLFSLLNIIAPEEIINTLYSYILSSDYSSNWYWRVQQNSNVGITNQPGNNALYLTTLVAFCVAKIILANTKGKKIIYTILVILAMIAIFTTTKRAAILFNGLSIVTLLVVYSWGKYSFIKMMKAVFSLILVVSLFFVLYVTTDVFSGLIGKNESLLYEDDISNGRIALWNYAIEKFTENPIFGIGLKRIYAETMYDVHNVYLQLLAETGLIGFIFFIVFLLVVVSSSIRQLKFLNQCDSENVKSSVLMGVYLSIFFVTYGFVSNPFIEYVPLSIFIGSIFMANSYRYVKVKM